MSKVYHYELIAYARGKYGLYLLDEKKVPLERIGIISATYTLTLPIQNQEWYYATSESEECSADHNEIGHCVDFLLRIRFKNILGFGYNNVAYSVEVDE